MATLLRIATAGSVDDGKSTLIGRLLYDSKAVMEDQLASVERTSKERGHEYTDWRWSPTACGPSANRASPSTSPTATSPLPSGNSSSPTRRGTSSTPNMVTRASTAQLVFVFVDARRGRLEHSGRHAFLASLLGIQHSCWRSTKWTYRLGQRNSR